MAKKLEYQIGVDSSDAQRGIKDFARTVQSELKNVEGDFEDTATAGDRVARVLSQMASEMDQQLERAAAASDALKTALGDVGERADVGSIITDLQRMGLTFEDIVTDADKLGAALKQLDDVQMKGAAAGFGGVKSNIKGAREEIERIPDSARGSGSVLANMVGNATQDFGALTGVAGSAGVAIGQMGEYMADAALGGEQLSSVIGNFAKVAGPVAALAIAFQAISSAQANAQESAKLTAESIEQWTEAIKEGGDVATNMNATLEEQGGIILNNARNMDLSMKILTNLPVIGWFGDKDQEDISGLFDAAALGMDQYTKAVVEGGKAEDDVRAAIDESNLSEKEKSKILDKLGDDIDDYNKASENRARNEKRFASTAESTNDILQGIIDKQEPLSRFTDQWNILFGDMADGTIDTQEAADAVDLLSKKLGITKDAVVGLAKAELGKTMAANADKVNDALAGVKDRIDEIKQQKLDDEMADSAANAEKVNDALAGVKDQIEEGKEKQEEYNQKLLDAQTLINEMSGAFENMTRKSNALSSVFDLGNAGLDALGAVQDVEDSIRDLRTFIKEEGVPDIFDPDAVDASEFLSKIESLREPIQQAITNAFAAGGPQAAADTANLYIDRIVEQLHGRLTRDQVIQLLGLGDLMVQIGVALDQSAVDTVKQQLDVLTGLNGENPYTASIGFALEAGTITPEAAEILVQAALEGAGVLIPSALDTPDTTAAKEEAAKFAEEFGILMEGPNRTGFPAFVDVDSNADETYAEMGSLVLGPGGRGWFSHVNVGSNAAEVDKDIGDAAADRDTHITVSWDWARASGPWGSTPPWATGSSAAGTSAAGVATTGAPSATPSSTAMVRAPAVARTSAPTVVINQTIQAAVIGAPFDVMRAVDTANRKVARLLPARP